MKKFNTIVLLLSLFGNFLIEGQTTYTFHTTGDYANSSNWTNGIPPATIPSTDAMVINAEATRDEVGVQNNDGTITINSGARLINNGGAFVDRNMTTIESGGTIDINSGNGSSGYHIDGGHTTNNGTINNNIVGGTVGLLFMNGSSFTISSTGVLNNTGWLYNAGGTITLNGILNNENANTSDRGIFNSGTIKGTGTIVSTNNNTNVPGTISPGNSTGILNVTNNITFSGKIDMEITGRGDSDGGVAGTDFDLISSTNAATITLENATVDLIFTGTNFYNGDTYTLFDAGTVTIVGTLSITNNNGYIIQHQGNGVFLIFSGALPVELIDFTARENDQTVILQWRTASELNNHGFQAQRSTDGKKWQNLAFLPGHGTTHEEQSYTYTDERPLPGLNYYRLRQEDFDGQFEYSQIVSIKMRNGGSGIRLFPNPATHSVTLALETDYDGEATLTLHDITGKQVRTQVLPLEGGTFRSSIELAGLPAGLYLAEVQAGREQWQERLVVE